LAGRRGRQAASGPKDRSPRKPDPGGRVIGCAPAGAAEACRCWGKRGFHTPTGRYLRVSFKLRELVDADHYKTVVDRCFPLAEAAAAHRYMESGTRTGAVVVTVGR
jgi:NADPH:quinone reductase-like Zn-dependent oxidoreductase